MAEAQLQAIDTHALTLEMINEAREERESGSSDILQKVPCAAADRRFTIGVGDGSRSISRGGGEFWKIRYQCQGLWSLAS